MNKNQTEYNSEIKPLNYCEGTLQSFLKSYCIQVLKKNKIKFKENDISCVKFISKNKENNIKEIEIIQPIKEKIEIVCKYNNNEKKHFYKKLNTNITFDEPSILDDSNKIIKEKLLDIHNLLEKIKKK